MKALAAVLLCALLGCAASNNKSSQACALTDVLSVSPTSASANHSAAAPGNQQQFNALLAPTAAPGCAVPAFIALVNAAWSTSDPLDVQIGNVAGSNNGLATCINATTQPVTVTATYTASGTTLTSSATLTCK